MPARLKHLLSAGMRRAGRSRAAFQWSRYRYGKDCVADPAGGGDPALLETLARDGLVIVADYWPRTRVDRVVEESWDSLERLRRGDYDGPCRHLRYPDYGEYRLLEIERVSKSSRPFFEDSGLQAIARSYVCKAASSYQRMISYRPDPGRLNTADTVHFDDWRHRLKAFLYLTDVGPEQAPLVYYKGSHRPAPWRHPHELEYFQRGKQGRYGHLTPYEVEHLQRKHGYERVIVTGQAGTLILTDTRGLHRGSPLCSGHRLVLANYFALRNLRQAR